MPSLGNCAENTAKKLQINRTEQDEYAINSYKKAARSHQNGIFKSQIIPVKTTMTIEEDEEYKKVDLNKFPKLSTVFQRAGGTITAGNASKLSDAAAAVVLASEDVCKKMNLKPLARIVGYFDAATDSIDFPIAPALAMGKVSWDMKGLI